MAPQRRSPLECGKRLHSAIALHVKGVPDAKTLARIAQALGRALIAQLHQGLVGIAQEHSVVKGRKMRGGTRSDADHEES